ncbi:MAG: hypothetical protein QOI99_1675 [Actinomycetota bacterium]|nr:hypothetical protein [Actinomycetota bacterium]
MSRRIPGVADIRRRLGYAPRPALPSAPSLPSEPARGPASEPIEGPDAEWDGDAEWEGDGGTQEAGEEAVPRSRDRLAAMVVRHPVASVTALLTAVLTAFSGLWTGGSLLIDGPGIALYVRLATDYLAAIGRVPYWIPEMWSGSPVWGLAPSLPALMLVPVASVFGADVAVKVGVLAFQVAGGVGTYVLARSIWGRTPANLVAALVYTLHPFVISHGVLAGAETASGVLAAVPWLVWSLRLGLRGEGTRYVVIAGLVSAFAVLHQAELAYGLAILCAVLVVSEVGRLRSIGSTGQVRRVLGRAAAVGGLALGLSAYWLLPFRALSRSFVLSPPELVKGELYNGIGATIGREIGIFFSRTTGLSGTISFSREGILSEFFYLGWVCVFVSLLSLVLISRRDGERTLAAVLLVALFGVWMSTAAVPLASSGPALRHQWPGLALAGTAAGLAIGAFVRRLGLRRGGRVVAVVGGVALLIAAPFVTPFLDLQTFVPLLASLRSPRFYVVAPLGLALGTAYPVVHLAREGVLRPSWRVLRPAVVAGVIAAAFLVDVLPYRSFYRLHPPADAAAYKQMAASLASVGGDARISTGTIDPRSITAVMATGRPLSVGWPHPVAGVHNWRLSGDAYVAPFGYREAAYGLSSTGYLAVEETSATGSPDEAVADIRLIRNPRLLPMVRTYDQAVVVGDGNLSPLLATSLAARNVAVVTGGRSTGASLGGMPVASVPAPTACQPGAVSALGPLAGEVAVACALDPWVGAFFAGSKLEPLAAHEIGGVYQSLANGLRGVAVWLDGNPGTAELALYELGADGRTLGPELARSQAVGADEYDLTTFTFDPILDSAGRRFVFLISCATCAPGLQAHVITGPTRGGQPGNLVIDGRLQKERQVAFVPIHDRLPPATRPGTQATAQRPGPGEWRITTNGGFPAILVVAETYFPGWEATVDGHGVRVLETDGAFLGVPLPPGQHVVHLTYHRPAAAIVGRLISFGTLFGLVLAWWRGRRGRGRAGRGRSGAAGDALEVGSPPAEARGEPALDPEERRPGPPVAHGEGPGGEGDEAVLADVDDLEPRRRHQLQQRRRPEP